MQKRNRKVIGILCVITLIYFVHIVQAQEDEYWVWGGPDEDHGLYIYESEGYIYSYHRVFTETDSPDYRLKWDSDGALILNISSNHSINDITGYNGYLYTCGGFWDDDTPSGERKLSKWDSNWTLIWNKTWNPDSGWKNNAFRDIWTDGSNIITTGVIEHWDSDDYNWIIVKWDMEGNQIWSGDWGTYREDDPYSVWSDGDDVYVCGDYNSWRNSALLKLNATGTLNWVHDLNDHNLQSVWGDDEGNVYTCGEDDGDVLFGDKRLVLIKWSSDGEIIWHEYWGKRNYRDVGSIVVGSDSNLFTIGKRFHEKTEEMDIVVLKWDFEGKVITEKYLSYSDRDWVQDAWLSDDYLYLNGYSYNETEYPNEYQGSDCFIIKISVDFESDKIPGYSVFTILGILVIGVCILLVKITKRQKY